MTTTKRAKEFLSAYNILKNLDGFADLPKEAQLFIMKNFGKVNFGSDFSAKKKLNIDQKTLKKFHDKNVFQYNSVPAILSVFEEIHVELDFTLIFMKLQFVQF